MNIHISVYYDTEIGKGSSFIYFYIKNGGKLLVRITGKKKFSKDLPQGGKPCTKTARGTKTRRNSFVKKLF